MLHLYYITQVYSHKLVDTECKECQGEMHPIKLGDYCGKTCATCHRQVRGGLSGFWSKGKVGIWRSVIILFNTFYLPSSNSQMFLVWIRGV